MSSPFATAYDPRLGGSTNLRFVVRTFDQGSYGPQDEIQLHKSRMMDMLSSSPLMSVASSNDYSSPEEDDGPCTPPMLCLPPPRDSTSNIFDLMAVASSSPVVNVILTPQRKTTQGNAQSVKGKGRAEVAWETVSSVFRTPKRDRDAQDFFQQDKASPGFKWIEPKTPQPAPKIARLSLRPRSGSSEINELRRQLFQVSRPDDRDIEWLVNTLIQRNARYAFDGISDVALSWICGLRTWLKGPHVDSLSWLMMAIQMAFQNSNQSFTSTMIRKALLRSNKGRPLPSTRTYGLTDQELHAFRCLRNDLDELCVSLMTLEPALRYAAQDQCTCNMCQRQWQAVYAFEFPFQA